MKKRFCFKKIIFFSLMLMLSITYTLELVNILDYPSQINVSKGSNKELDIVFPFTVEILENRDKVLELNESYKDKLKLSIKNNYNFKPVNNGMAKLGINFLGLVPVKQVNFNVIEDKYLIPGGEALGVKLNTKGVLVVGTSEIEGVNRKKYNPALDAGIKIGDSIIEIDNKKVKDANHVIEILNNIGDKKVQIVAERDNKRIETELIPVKSKQDNSYRLGIWVRDKTAGIGTLTFYDEESEKFGALGHSITDADTGTLMNAENGEIMKAQISSVEQGKKGTPGEIRGMFFESDNVLGKIESNTIFGIYGKMYKENKITKKKSFPVALQNEVKTGKAYILTTVEDDKVEEYEVEVVKTDKQYSPEPKSMVIKVTDKRLLEKTGGIVRGMSGSPIIQNGKIIGAVTHVFVNDPTKGYGLYIEWMMKESGMLDNKQEVSHKVENNYSPCKKGYNYFIKC